jgi:hypothetical protein
MGTKTLEATTANGEARCQTTTETGRQCILPVHQDSVSHKYVNRDKVHKPLKDMLPAGFTLTATEVAKTDVLKKATTRQDTKPRDDEQKRVDQDAKKNYAKNHGKHNAGEDFAVYFHAEYIVPPRAVDTVLDYLRRAGGTGGTAKGSVFRYRKGAHGSGNVRIQWAFIDPAPKQPATPAAQ